MNERKTFLKYGAVVTVVTAALVVATPLVQAQAPAGCAVWSHAEHRCLEAAPPGPGRGAQPLTATTFAAAQAVPTMNALIDVSSPFLIAMRVRGLSDLTVAKKATDAPYFLDISTPFTRAAEIALEARRTFRDPVFPAIDALNADRLTVRVSSGTSLHTVDAIENVIVKHGDKISKPLRAQVVPTVVQNALGAKKASAEGAFMFDFYVFDPQYGPLTLVLIGKGGNFEWEMTADELAQLK